MRKIVTIVMLLGISLSLPCLAEEAAPAKSSFVRLDKIVAVVERNVITQSQLSQEITQAKKQLQHTGEPMPSEREIRKLALDNLINKSLQLQLAKKGGITVSQEDVDKAIDRVAKANKLSLAKLKEALMQTGINFDDYKSQIMDQLTIQRLQQEALAKTVSFTPEDIKKFLRENKDKFHKYDTYHVIDILLPVEQTAPGSNITRVKKDALAIGQQLRITKDNDAVIKAYPQAQLNDLGWRAIGEFPALFQAKVAPMSINGVSDPIQAPNGFHLLKVIEARGQGIAPDEKTLKNMAYQYKMTEAAKEWTAKMRQEAYVKIMY